MTTATANPFVQLSDPWPAGWRLVALDTEHDIDEDHAVTTWSLVLNDGVGGLVFTADEDRSYTLSDFARRVVVELDDDNNINRDLNFVKLAASLARDLAVVICGDVVASEVAPPRIIDLGGPQDGRFWRVASNHSPDHEDARAAAIYARLTGSVGCTFNDAAVERVDDASEVVA